MIDLDKVKTLGIIGDRNNAKTSLMVSLAKNYKGKRNIVFYSYPQELPKEWSMIHTLQELEMLTDSIIVIDEWQLHFKLYNTRMNEQILEILSTIAHNNNTLIFSTPMTQFLTKALDCFIDGFLYVKISDLGSLKNGSLAKRQLQNFSHIRIGRHALRLNLGEYLQIVQGQESTNGLQTFTNPNIAKAWRKSK